MPDRFQTRLRDALFRGREGRFEGAPAPERRVFGDGLSTNHNLQGPGTQVPNQVRRRQLTSSRAKGASLVRLTCSRHALFSRSTAPDTKLHSTEPAAEYVGNFSLACSLRLESLSPLSTELTSYARARRRGRVPALARNLLVVATHCVSPGNARAGGGGGLLLRAWARALYPALVVTFISRLEN